ncbi:MAG: HAMP domain-containing sensor histidine kinase [Acidobacteriaceae bacterium]
MTRRNEVEEPTQSRAESPDRLAHDARNVLSGLMLYCELLSAPGVLNEPHGHYAGELEGIAKTAAQILEKIIEVAVPPVSPAPKVRKVSEVPALPTGFPVATAVPLAAVPVTHAADDLRRLHPLLAAIAGPGVRLSVATMPCAGQTALAVEDLTRILVNLVRNAADAMPKGGHVRVTAQYGDGLSFVDVIPRVGAESGAIPGAISGPAPAPRSVVLSVSDDGPGIPESLRVRVFDLGYTSHKESESAKSASWPAPRRRGLGLSIVRNLVEAAGGAVRVSASHTGGARFEITLPLNQPVTSGTCSAPPDRTFPADSTTKGCIECQ